MTGPKESPALRLYNVGADHFKNGRLDPAIDCFKRAVAVDAEFYRGWAYLGMAYAQAGQVDAAIEAYRKCIDINGQYHKALNNVGELYLRKGLLDYASMVFKMATEAAPEQGHYFYNLGITYAEIGMRPQAEAAFVEAVRLDPSDVGTAMELSQVRFNLKKYADAARGLSEFIQKNPEHPRAAELQARIKMLERKAKEETSQALPPPSAEGSQVPVHRAEIGGDDTAGPRPPSP
jgi:tetratricopeptide (TPR) repeat protein